MRLRIIWKKDTKHRGVQQNNLMMPNMKKFESIKSYISGSTKITNEMKLKRHKLTNGALVEKVFNTSP